MSAIDTPSKGRVRIIRAKSLRSEPLSSPAEAAQVIDQLQTSVATSPVGRKRVLNTGAGSAQAERLHPVFAKFASTRLDLDPSVRPDILGSITNLTNLVSDQEFDAIWCSHSLEHVDSHEVLPTLQGFRRVLKPDGFVLITCPDLEAIAEQLLKHGVKATAYVSPAGPITALDMLYGHIASVARGNGFMRHKTGFTVDSLGEVARAAGFAEAHVAKGRPFDLWALLLMPQTNRQELRALLSKTPERFLVEQWPES